MTEGYCGYLRLKMGFLEVIGVIGGSNGVFRDYWGYWNEKRGLIGIKKPKLKI